MRPINLTEPMPARVAIHQVSAHIGTIVIAAILKVSYVLRCVAQHGLGQEVR
ncbi:hypothetical protein [Pseudoalteromonas sp. NZS11]|uniref:hypothetical protein n=1 Tax=Pseudoalteromonas sp. NZS11 TaxID=2792049 RepID=UPI0018CD8C17|nr:hypothetical protein [Pseudoalteromonas sp. NZS11]MBH0081513.1 hypothetical protein [Pseudoalteromonas sp. NZS11]